MARLHIPHKTKIKLALDTALTATFVVLLEPRVTGMTWHEWVGLAFGAALIVHVLLSWKWVVTVVRRFLGALNRQTRVNAILNLALFVTFVALIVSGIIISENLRTAEALGLSFQARANWREIHVWTPNVALVLIGLHLGLHWKWVVSTFKRYLPKRHVRRTAPRPKSLPELS